MKNGVVNGATLSDPDDGDKKIGVAAVRRTIQSSICAGSSPPDAVVNTGSKARRRPV
ncbi:MAG: hypothetical protein AB7P22_05570 [Vicinamibacterales bacterium]